MKSQGGISFSNFVRRVLASTVALTVVMQNFAWAVCSDGSYLPSGGYVIGVPPVQYAANWSPNIFTGTAGSLWVPDTSVNEHNDPTQPLTGGGHNWVFDQGSTLCKVTDKGPAGQTSTAWEIPPNNLTDCVILPVIKAGQVTNLGDIPYQGDVITPTCDPSLLSQPGIPNPGNSYFNQLGCSISHGVATTPATATSFLFVAGIKGGLFSIPLDNVGAPVVGGSAGKTVGPQNYYSQIPEGTLLTNAAVSKDGQFAIATSIRRDLRIWGCLNPLGDPGDPGLPINPQFFSPPASTVFCMQVGSNNLAANLTSGFGPDNQPYFGGRRVVNSFNSVPGGSFTTSWPNCIWQTTGALSLADAFANDLSNGCGDAQPNFGFTSALIVEPPAMISHGNYIYIGPIGGTILQFAVTTEPFSGFSHYAFRTYMTGLSILTGLGVAEDLQSLMVYSDPTAIGLAGQEIVTKVPLCEDMLGEVVATGDDTGTPATTDTTGLTGTTSIAVTADTTGTTSTATTAPTSSPVAGAFVGGGSSAGPNTDANSTKKTAASAKAASGVFTAATARTGAAAASSVNNAPITPSPLVVSLPGPPTPTSTNAPSSAAVTFVSQQGLPRIAQNPASGGSGNISSGASGSGNINSGASGGGDGNLSSSSNGGGDGNINSGSNANLGNGGDTGSVRNGNGGRRNARGGRHGGRGRNGGIAQARGAPL
jgi:hypothetical protein